VTRGPHRSVAEPGALFPSSAATEEAAPKAARHLKITPADRPAGQDPPRVVDPASAFLTALEVIARYGWGRTKGYRMLRSEGFPRPIGGDRYRLDTLIAWENAQLAATRPAKPVPSLPPRKRGRAGCGQ
jgi:predicted DNA-binding transcriptional regulator AlpA